MNTIIYYTGLVIALLFILFSLDDLVFDFLYPIIVTKKQKQRLDISKLDDTPHSLLCVMIAAWHEDSVIEDMIKNLLQTIHYPKTLFHLFIGIYPNDSATYKVVEKLEKKYSNVHMVMNSLPGPTNKAQNLNNIIEHIIKFENQHKIRFSTFIIHDAEDVIHPTSFKLINYLSYKHDAIQLPVFPLQPYPTIHTFFKFITSTTYADEFAENHYRSLPTRQASNAFVPSAGTGFAFSHRVLDKIGSSILFSEDNLTEDYSLSLRFKQLGIHTHFFIEGLQRVLNNGKVIVEYVATKELFPNTFHEAVKQKSRWIYGISFQTFSIIDIIKSKNLSLFSKYSLYKDWKAKFSNLFIVIGYILFLYIILSFFFNIPTIYPYHSFSWYLSILLTLFMIERQLTRAISLKNIYGWRSMIAGCFIPPIIPIRIVWGNIINFTATISAWKTYIFGMSKNRNKRPRWQKTEHSYISPQALKRYKRKLGDIILEKQLIDSDTLYHALKQSKNNAEPLGQTLKRLKIISEDDLCECLGEILGIQYLKITNDNLPKYFPQKNIYILEKYNVIPIISTKNHLVLASSEPISDKIITEISSCLKKKVDKIVLASPQDILQAIENLKKHSIQISDIKFGEYLLDHTIITIEQLIDALRVQKTYTKQLGEILMEMGVILKEDLEPLLKNYKLYQQSIRGNQTMVLQEE